MVDYGRLTKALVKRLSEGDSLSGLLGYEIDGTMVVVAEDTKKFYVRFPNGNFVAAYHFNRVPANPGMPVKVSTDRVGNPVIVGMDTQVSGLFGNSGYTNVGPHDHVRGSGMEYIVDSWFLKQFRVDVSSGLTLSVAQGAYFREDELMWFEGDTYNLTPYLPSAPTYARWVIVSFDPDTGEVVSTQGDEFLAGAAADFSELPLTPALENGYIPLCAVYLVGGSSTIPSYYFEDLRFAQKRMTLYLNDLSNVEASGYEGYVLTYTSGVWRAMPPTGGSGGGGASDAEDVSYDNTASGLTADNVQDALDELATIGGGGELTKTIRTETIIWEKTLGSAGVFDSNNADTQGRTGITGDYDDLIIELIDAKADVGSAQGVLLAFNNDTTAGNYQSYAMYGGSSAGTYMTSGSRSFGSISGDTSYRTHIRLELPNYKGTSYYKTGYRKSADARSSSSAFVDAGALTWRSSAAVSRVALSVDNANVNFATGTKLRIIGVKEETVGGGNGGGLPGEIILDYTETTTLWNGTGISSGTWYDVFPNQTFTVTDDETIIEFSMRIAMPIGFNALQYGMELVIDSAGTPITRFFGGGYANNGAGSPGNPASIFFEPGDLSLGSHTVKVRFKVNTGGNSVFLRATANAPYEGVAMQVIQHARGSLSSDGVYTGGLVGTIIPALKGSADIAGVGGGGIDEEYDTATTGLTWSPSTPTTVDSNTTRPSHLYVLTTDNTERFGTRAWSPAGDFDLRTYSSFGSEIDSNVNGWGLHVQDSTNANRLLLDYGRSGTSIVVQFYTYASGSYTQRGSTFTVSVNGIYRRITRVGSLISAYWSIDGYAWIFVGSHTFSITVSDVGYRMFNNTGVGSYMFVDFLRSDV